MFKMLPHAKLCLYPDSGHGFLYQYAQEFAADIARFLHVDRPKGGAVSGRSKL